MKIFLLLGTGRAGVDFLQTLFDKHPEISQFPGVFLFNIFLKKIKNKNKNQIAKKFINEHERFFNSKIYKQERHDELGRNRNEYFTVSKKKFIQKFIQLCKNTTNLHDLFINLHLAYSAASGENISKKKIILLNIHNIENITFLDFFDYKIILSLRNPISSINSSISHWLAYSKKNVDLWWLHYQINRLSNLIENCMKFKKEIYIVKLDLLHTKNSLVMSKILKIMNIKNHPNLKKSTYHGKLWWGDKLSGKNLNGINKNFKETHNSENFFKKDIVYLESCLNFYYKIYKYKKIYKKFHFKNIYKLMPLKIELIVWKNLIFNLNFLQIFLIPYYYIKRIKILKAKHQLSRYPKII
tara:strand:+ start:430 stop:1494 length:1065 start_codon:yes stop_codon:yes gene_type:complete